MRNENTYGGRYTVRRIHGTGVTRKRERGHTQRGYIRRGDTHGVGTHRGWTYTIRGLHGGGRGDTYGERAHTERGYIRSGDIHGGGGNTR